MFNSIDTHASKPWGYLGDVVSGQPHGLGRWTREGLAIYFG